MAFYIQISKIDESEQAARYRFEGDGGKSGIFEIAKSSGEVTLIEPMPDDEKGHFFNRAAVKILKEWREGVLPETSEWAS